MTANDAFERGRQLLERFVSGRGDPADRDRAIDLLEEAIGTGALTADDDLAARAALASLLSLRIFPVPIGSAPSGVDIFAFAELMRTGLDLTSPATRADVERSLRHMRHVTTVAAGTPLADHLHGMLAILEMFAAVPDPANTDAAGSARVREILGGATRAMEPSPRRDLVAALRGVLLRDSTDAGGLVAALSAMIDTLPADSAVLPSLLGETATVLARLGEDGDPAVVVTDAPRLVETALAAIAADDPRRADLERKLSGLLVARAAYTADPADVDRVVARAEELLADPHDDADVVRGRDHFLRAMTLALRARRDSSQDDLRRAVADLQRALELVPASDPVAPAIAATFGALLHDRALADGVLADADAARFHLAQAQAVLQATAVAGADADRVDALAVLPRAVSAIHRRDPAALIAVIGDLSDAVRRFPSDSPWRARLRGILGLARLAHGVTVRKVEVIRAGLDDVARAAAATTVDSGGRRALNVLDAMAEFLGGLLDNDQARISAGAVRLTDPTTLDRLSGTERVAVLTAAGLSGVARFDADGDPTHLDTAIGNLTRASEQVSDDDGNPQAPNVLRGLAQAHIRRAATRTGAERVADQDRGVSAGLAGLRANAVAALLQTEPAHALSAVRAAAGDARRVADWCLDGGRSAGRPADAVAAIELGRALVLHVTASAARVTGILREAGHGDLAEEWAAAGAEADRLPLPGPDGSWVLGTFLDGSAPSDLRRRVVSALRDTAAMRDLLAPPDPAAIADALRRNGSDALVYMLPADGRDPGRLLVVAADGEITDVPAPRLRVAADGPLREFVNTAGDGTAGAIRRHGSHRDLDPPGGTGSERWARVLDAVCDWAYPAGIEPLLAHLGDRSPGAPARVVLVAGGALGGVPWNAARRRDAAGYRYACADLVLSSAASARQFVDVAARRHVPRDAAAVLVADPTGGLPGAVAEVEALRTVIYPDAIVLGDIEGAAGQGTPAELLEILTGPDSVAARVVHLACHASAGASSASSFLRLAAAGSSPTRLRVVDLLRGAHRRVLAGDPLVVLSACTSDVSADFHDEALTLATALLAAGAGTVVGSRWAVPDAVTPVLMYLFHHHLTVRGRQPADALRAAQLWMLDPDRRAPQGMPADLIRIARNTDLTAVDAWAAFAHHGR